MGDSHESGTHPLLLSSRLGLAVIGFFGFVNLYALRVNMSVAIVCMINHTAIDPHGQSNQSSSSCDSNHHQPTVSSSKHASVSYRFHPLLFSTCNLNSTRREPCYGTNICKDLYWLLSSGAIYSLSYLEVWYPKDLEENMFLESQCSYQQRQQFYALGHLTLVQCFS